jgi:hypothetical protein
MGRTPARVIAVVLCAGLLIGIAGTAQATPITDQERAGRAVAYLASHQKANGSIVAFSAIGSTADAVSSFAAAGVGRTRMNRALGYLRTQVGAGHVDSIGLLAKVVLAVTAAGENPRDFGGMNLIRSLRDTLAGGHFGDSAVFDDATAVLALEAAGITPGNGVAAWLLAAQCPDGGWAYDLPYGPGDDEHCFDGTDTDFFTSDSNATSLAVQALTGMDTTDWVESPFAFFDTVRDGENGGWAYSAAFVSTDANSTGLVLQAYVAAGLPIPNGGLIALRKLQYPGCGAFAYTYSGDAKGGPDIGATIGAVPGLVRAPFPVTGPVASGLPKITDC